VIGRYREHVTGPHTTNFAEQLLYQYTTPAMPNKTGRKELSSESIAVILALHKLGYSASRIREGLTKDIPKSTITW